MKTKLLPCPFCGGEPEINQSWIYCHHCGAKISYGKIEDSAEAWNTRKDPLLELIEARINETIKRISKYQYPFNRMDVDEICEELKAILKPTP